MTIKNRMMTMTTREIVAVLSTLGVLASTIPSDSKPSEDMLNTANEKSDQTKSKSPEK